MRHLPAKCYDFLIGTYRMTPQYINLNGDILLAGQALLPTTNRAFKYGDGLFESMRLMRGKLKYAQLHANRLQAGMKALHIDGYAQVDAYFLNELCAELAAHHKTQNARLRLTVFRDAGGLYTPDVNTMGYCMELQPTDETRYTLNQRGLIMDLYTDMPKAVNVLSNYKTCNALNYVMAGLYKNRNKLDDAFLINQEGYLCEAISSNVFVLFDGHLYTPALTEGCVAGVMRQVVIDLAANLNIPLSEAQLAPGILNQADEVFLTNAARGIQWVMGYGGRRYFNQLSKVLLDALNATDD
jgi:branched-subunit amino acid aminotransferase/4-amino-4-deoxychorismate lyase